MDLHSMNKDMLIKLITEIQDIQNKEHKEELEFYKDMNARQMKLAGRRIRKCSFPSCKALYAVVQHDRITYKCERVYTCRCKKHFCNLHYEKHKYVCELYQTSQDIYLGVQ